MEILTIILTVNHGTCYDEIRHSFTTSKSFEYATSVHTIQMMLDDIKREYTDIQILDDIEYNIFSKTLKIKAKVID